jgi:hypothetical protein
MLTSAFLFSLQRTSAHRAGHFTSIFNGDWRARSGHGIGGILLETSPDVFRIPSVPSLRFLFPGATIIEAWRSSGRCSKAEVKKRVDALPREGPNVKDIGLSWYDTNTFFHRRHVSSLKSRSAEERLSSNQVVRIRAALAEDIAAAGL